MNKFLSRKFIVAVVSAILLVLNEGLGLNIPKDVVMPFVLLICTYLLGQSAVDVVGALKQK